MTKILMMQGKCDKEILQITGISPEEFVKIKEELKGNTI